VNSTTGEVAVNPNDEVVCTFTNTRIPDLTVTASPSPQQYSDKVELKAALDPNTATGTVDFYVGASAATCGSGTPVANDVTVVSGEAKSPYTIDKVEGSYTVTACFDSDSDNFADSKGTGTLTVTPEDASFTPDAGNIYSYPLGTESGTKTLKVYMYEKGTTELNLSNATNWAAGNIDLQPAPPGFPNSITATLTPQNGGGGPLTVTCTVGTAGATGYNKNRPIECSFSGLQLEIYEFALTVGTSSSTTDDYYAGTYETIVAVTDPNAKLPSGGGWIQLDDALGKSYLNFGFNYSLQGKNKTVKGGLVAIRHFTEGDFAGWVCRVKTNSLGAPTKTAKIGTTDFWYSSFSGTNASYSCRNAAGVLQESAGNQTLAAYVEDYGEPGRDDTFWIKVTGKINMPFSAPATSKKLNGGNIQVPKPQP
jgi:hypothetical protein